MTKVFLRLLGVTILISGLIGCNKKEEPATQDFASRPEVKAPGIISASFKAQSLPQIQVDDPALKNNRQYITIQKDSLEKEFLLQAEMITQPKVPMFHGLKSRIVAFKKIGDVIYLLEATQGHTVTNDLPQKLLLAAFPVVEENDAAITFDFNKGMSHIFVTGDWTGSDFEEGNDGPLGESMKVNISFIDRTEYHDNQFVIHQVVQTEGPSMSQLGVTYYLSPYEPAADYVPTRSVGFDKFGFFEVAPLFTTSGGSVIYASKFNIAQNKPIIYAISANTPADYKDAVREGVLYWNKAFGREVIKVEEATTTAPNARQNIVQWVTWDNAGFAYADAQMDPRTGEIKHAQIMMTSVFAFSGRAKAQVLLKKLNAHTDHKELSVSLRGFQKESMCDLEAEQNLIQSLTALVNSNATDEQILKASQDYVREVVAHEVGHTLGLRHNFAGSLSANFKLADRDNLFKSYIDTGHAPQGLITSSSVMEYQLFEEASMTGDQTKKESQALPYDLMAIRNLYDNEQYNKADVPIFCTDSHAAKKFVDCVRFDTGSSIVEHALWVSNYQLEGLPFAILNKFINAKYPAFDALAVPLNQVSIDTETVAVSVIDMRKYLIDSLTEKGRLVKVEREFDYSTELNKRDIEEAKFRYLKSETEKYGGLSRLLASVPDDFAMTQYNRFIEMLEAGKFNNLKAPTGQTVEFTTQEWDVIKATTLKMYTALQDTLALKDIKQLKENAGAYGDYDISYDLAATFAEKVSQYLLSESKEAINANVVLTIKDKDDKTKTQQVDLTLPKYVFNSKVRKASADLLVKGRASGIDWGITERDHQEKTFTEYLKSKLGGNDIGDIKTTGLPRDVLRWILESQSLKATLESDSFSAPDSWK